MGSFAAYGALAALQLIGGFQQADIIRKNGDLQASVDNLNAEFADLDSHNALDAGYTSAARYESVVDTTIGNARSAYASEGVSVGYGTAGDIEADNRIAGLTNVLQMQRSARDQAMGYQTQAINLRIGGQFAQLQANLNASSAQSQGIMSAIGTGVSGYERSLSTGKGQTSRTGTNDQSWKNQSTTVHLTPSGDGVMAPPSSDLKWYPDEGKGGIPGFFGHYSRDYNKSLGNFSFTDETGG